MDGMSTYFGHLKSLLDKVLLTQREVIEKSADCFVATLLRGGRLFAFGSSHAGMITQELFYRTGGLAVVNPIFAPGLSPEVSPVTLSSQMERLPEYGRLLAQKSGMTSGDTLLIHSVSGRNPVAIDLALEARSLGVTCIALTSLEYSRQVSSRHPIGKRLYELCDLVIDNCGCYGDAAIVIPGFVEQVAPTSTVIGAAIVNALSIRILELCLQEGLQPPFLVSANTDRGDAYNQAVFARFREQILYRV